ncbi:MAG TPA: helix-turn-helix domain-containing protein [Longimicrobiales bacterium]
MPGETRAGHADTGAVQDEPGLLEEANGPEDLPLLDDDAPRPPAADEFELEPAADLIEDDDHTARDRLISRFERRDLARRIECTSGNMSRAARIAGVDRTTLYRLMDKHGFTVQRRIGERRSGAHPGGATDEP